MRLRETIELALEAKGKREEGEWKRAAFIGWQGYLMSPRKKGSKRKTFAEWLKMLGLEEKRKTDTGESMTIKEEVSLIKRLRQKAKKAFGGG